ncbi:c-type cytochrome [Verrucomicrobia bacterium]|nr:c-type cytochrome [Verrucomicrobiota bacterium]
MKLQGMPHRLTLFLALLLCHPGISSGQIAPLTPLEPTGPEDAHKTFDLQPGFTIELLAAEPLIADPVALAFEETGTLYVAEMRGYSERRDQMLGQVKRLIDKDGDRRMDQATVFADNLQWPTALHCYNGGVFVLAAPDLIYLKDTTGDGVADSRKTVLTGFCVQASRLNVQQLPNSMRWGLDQMIHIAEGGNGSRLRRPDQPESEAVSTRRGTIVFDPATHDFRIINGGGQFGMAYDDAGRRFLTSNSRHIMQVPYDELPKGTRSSNNAPRPTSLKGIAIDGDAAPVFRISPDENWRVLRTEWRVTGKVGGPVEGGGRPSGYFTGATGVCIYRGVSTSMELNNVPMAFIADAGSNLIHRKALSSKGPFKKAQRANMNERREFLASVDNWFRPVQIENGPHNGLYILDMYREVIEHPWSLPPGIKEHLDLNRGFDRGRIWHMRHKEQPFDPLSTIDRKTVLSDFTNLASTDVWKRQTHTRLIFEELSKLTTLERRPHFKQLQKEITVTKSSVARIQLLSLLHRFGQSTLLLLTQDPDVQLVVLKNLFRSGSYKDYPPESNLDAWRRLLDQPESEELRYHSALFLSGAPFSQKGNWELANLLFAHAASVEMNRALRFLIHNLPAPPPETTFNILKDSPLFEALQIRSMETMNSEEIISLLEGNQGKPGFLTLTSAAATRPKGKELKLTASLKANIRKTALASLDNNPQMAIRALSLFPTEQRKQILTKHLFDNHHSTKLANTLDYLQSNCSQTEYTKIFQELQGFSPGIQQRFLANSIHQKNQPEWLLGLLGNEPHRTEQIGEPLRNQFRGHRILNVRKQARTLFGKQEIITPSELLTKFKPALTMQGNKEKGAEHFKLRCATCHQAGNSATSSMGPNLTTVVSAGRPSMLINILDPSREVASQYEAWNISYQDGDSEVIEIVARIISETNEGMVIRTTSSLPGETTTLAKSDIKSQKATGRSIMPDGLTAGMTPQDVADLFTFIETIPR